MKGLYPELAMQNRTLRKRRVRGDHPQELRDFHAQVPDAVDVALAEQRLPCYQVVPFSVLNKTGRRFIPSTCENVVGVTRFELVTSSVSAPIQLSLDNEGDRPYSEDAAWSIAFTKTSGCST